MERAPESTPHTDEPKEPWNRPLSPRQAILVTFLFVTLLFVMGSCKIDAPTYQAPPVDPRYQQNLWELKRGMENPSSYEDQQFYGEVCKRYARNGEC